jgi:transposase
MTTRRSFTDEFKREAAQLAKERGNVTATARELGISSTSLDKWVKQLQTTPDNPFPGNGNPRDKEFAQLQRELRRVKEENEILKKAVGIFTVRSQ